MTSDYHEEAVIRCRNASIASLASGSRERLAAYKVPKHFVKLDEFPRTAAGKVQKHLLRHPREETS